MKHKPKRIDQLVPSYIGRDAIGNHVSLMQAYLKKRGFDSDIFVEMSSKETASKCHFYERYAPHNNIDSIAIYQFSVGSWIANYFLGLRTYKIAYYHNITPPEYFIAPELRITYEATSQGIRQMSLVKAAAHSVWTASRFNAQELVDNGFHDPQVFPVLRDYSRLVHTEIKKTLKEQLSTTKRNLLFVGRIEPHKGIQDLFFALKAAKATIDQNFRLILVGNASPFFFKKLKELATDLELSLAEGIANKDAFRVDILVAGSVSDNTLATLYRCSDIFVCLSDHEGFCVPLIEAMNFELPIIAHRSTAVPETCGEAAILIDKNKPVELISALKMLATSTEKLEIYREKAKNRALQFSRERLEQSFDSALSRALDDYSYWRGN